MNATSAVTGAYNVCYGYAAGGNMTGNAIYNTYVGCSAGPLNAYGMMDYNTLIGANATAQVSNTIVIGVYDNATVTGSIQIGAGGSGAGFSYSQCIIGGIYGSTTTSGPNMRVGSAGRLYRYTSSKRVKTNIVDLEIDTTQIFNLRPVSFDSLCDNDEDGRTLGFIAEEIAEVMPEIVSYGPLSTFTKNNKDTEIIPVGVEDIKLIGPIIAEMKKLRERVLELENDRSK